MKKFIIPFLVLVVISLSQMSIADVNLRNPQGRMGLTFKTEKYINQTNTNISADELAEIRKILNQNKKATKMSLKSQSKKEIKQVNKDEKIKESKNATSTKVVKKTVKRSKTKDKVLTVKPLNIPKNKTIKTDNQSDSDKNIKKTNSKTQSVVNADDNKKPQEHKRIFKIKNQEPTAIETISKTDAAVEDNAEKQNKNKSKQKNFSIFKKKTKNSNENTEQEILQNKTKSADSEQVTKKELPVKKIISNKKQDVETRLIIGEITDELTADRGKMLKDLSTLWVSAVQKSDTVYFAIMKLSNPNGEEVNKKGYKKILEPIVNAAPLVGQAFVNPALTAGSLIGSNVMGTMLNDSAKTRLAKVNDADLVILARAIDDLQETLLISYMAYQSALSEYKMAIKITEERKKEYEQLNSKNSPNVILASTFYTEAQDNQYKARQEFLMKRVVLEQIVGAEAILEIEKGDENQQENSANEQNKKEEIK